MTKPALSVVAYFELDAQPGNFLTLDDPVKGKLNDVLYPLAGPVATDITEFVRGYSVTRGRNRQIDEITAGVATIEAKNFAREFDPDYVDGDFYGDLLPGRRVTLAIDGSTIFDGNIDDWDFTYDVGGESTVTFEAVDALGRLAAMEFDEWTTTDGQSPGARLTAVLDRPEVAFPPAQRDIDTGTSTLQDDTVAWSTNVLNYAQLVARSDLGVLFASRRNTLTFYGRNRPVTGIGAPVLSDDGTEIDYTNLSRARGTELLFNRVGLARLNGSEETFTNVDSTQIYGVRSLTIGGLLMDSDQQTVDMAYHLLNLYQDPQPRIASVTVALDGISDADRKTIVELDIGSVVRVVYTPNGVGDPIDKFCMVEGVNPAGSVHGLHRFTLFLSNLADAFSGQPFTLNSTEFGVLDTDRLTF